jgi:hypothetical protein
MGLILSQLPGLRVEWSKCYARGERWIEEVDLTCEEMRRILSYFVWRAEWWTRQGLLREDVEEEMQEALIAYSTEQSQMLLAMGEQFASQWYPLLVANGVVPEWPARFLVNREGDCDMGEMDWVDEEEEGIDDDLDDIFE